METKLSGNHIPPEFDAKIADWVQNFPVDPDDFGGTINRIGIIDKTGGNRVIYRRVDADGMHELFPLLDFLRSIGLVDQHVRTPHFESVYGLPD